ncbi:MAG TPA: 4-hydroxy-tetrahydrodipicolinate reductase [Chloroflexi bacterium]|nr:4-hydroxy-tetrahydrodipicolinate reductase [Chloroflexota bacterium]
MEPIRVVINGALGRMGQTITKAVVCEPGLKAVGAVEKEVAQKYLPLAEAFELITLSSDLNSILKSCDADVVVDFTNAEVSIAAARITLKQKVNMVIGTTGLSEDHLAEIGELCQTYKVGAVVAPNFSLGAALLIHLSKLAAKFFDRAEIIEMHHDKKADAPSGTAIATARAMLQTHGKPFIYPEVVREVVSNTRGGQMDGIAIHSLRLPGFMAGQEVIFSGAGETLSLRHNTISRECYLPGVILAIKEVTKRKGLIYGLDALLKL